MALAHFWFVVCAEAQPSWDEDCEFEVIVNMNNMVKSDMSQYGSILRINM